MIDINGEKNDKTDFDETYSVKYNKRISIFGKLLLANSCICIVILSLEILKIYDNTNFAISYIFISMGILHVTGIIQGIMRFDDFRKLKNEEAIYLKTNYPEVWKKINPYNHIVLRHHFLKYEWGKYIPKNTDIIIDKTRKEKQKNMLYIFPFILTIIFIILELVI